MAPIADSSPEVGGGRLVSLWKTIWPDNVSNIGAILLAIIAAILGLVDVLEVKKLIAVTLAILALLGYSLIRDRVSRDKLTENLRLTLEASGITPADHFFSNKTAEYSILRTARTSACLIQETGSLVTERYRDELVRILKSGGELRFVVCLPSTRPTTTLAYRNKILEDSSAIMSRITGFHNQLRFIKEAAGPNSRNMQVRYTPYDVGYTLILSNSVKPSALDVRYGLVRIADFRVAFDDKLDFNFDNLRSPKVTTHFEAEFASIFNSSTKIVLLTGEPEIGKTTLFRELLSLARDASDVYSVLSFREEGKDNRSNCFAATSSESNTKRVFARKLPSSSFPDKDIRQYEINDAVWKFYSEELRGALLAKKLIVIDEIGEMQLRSQEFVGIIQEIICDPEIILFATVALNDSKHQLLRDIYQNHRSTIYHLTQENRSSIADELKSEFREALRLKQYMVENG
jgi:nucleoside-triphosphatase